MGEEVDKSMLRYVELLIRLLNDVSVELPQAVPGQTFSLFEDLLGNGGY